MEYTTERLLFREFTEEDFPRFAALFSNKEVMRYAYMDCAKTAQDLRPYFEKVLKDSLAGDSRTYYEFAVLLRSTDEFAGFGEIDVGIRNAHGGSGELGYFLLPQFWGQGYATELANGLCGLAFGDLGLHRIFATCNANNQSSENIMKKLGMVKEGTHRKARFKEGRWDDELRYSILIEEWRERNAPAQSGSL